MRFEILKSGSVSQPYRWRIVFSNGKIAAHSENYANKSDAEYAVNAVRRGAPSAQVFDLTVNASASYRR